MAESDGMAFVFPDVLTTRDVTPRDYFAAFALMAIIGKIPLLKDRDPNNVRPDVELVSATAGAEIRSAAAYLAYQYADEMMSARVAVPPAPAARREEGI